MELQMQPYVGQTAQYFGSNGEPTAAIVTMTALTHNPEKDPSGQFTPGDGDAVSLMVFRPSGHAYVRHNVPLEGTPAHTALVQAAEDYAKVAAMAAQEDDEDEDGPAVPPAPKPVVRCWKPAA
jgi:hypothetical protein